MTIERDTDRLRADDSGTRRGDRTEMTFTPRQRGLSLAAVIAARSVSGCRSALASR